MNHEQRRKVAALERRRDVLINRLVDWKYGDADRTKGEVKALNYALAIIKNADSAGVLRELEGGHA